MKKIVLGLAVLIAVVGTIVFINKPVSNELSQNNLTLGSSEQNNQNQISPTLNVENNKKEVKSIFETLEEKAKKGDVKAQNDLGNMYATGSEVEQSYQEALKLFESAAKKGYGEAQFNLGTMYQNAIGVEQDFEKAIKYYKQAASQGHAEAKENLQSICEENPELCK